MLEVHILLVYRLFEENVISLTELFEITAHSQGQTDQDSETTQSSN